MAKKIINYGSINIDYVYKTPHIVRPSETLNTLSLSKGLGGKGANQSVAIARSGGDVLHVGQVCIDDDWALSLMQESGVNTHYVTQVEEPSGHAIIQVDERGENAILLFGGANQSCRLASLEKAIDETGSTAYLLLQNECNDIEAAFNVALKNNIKVVLNPAPMSDEIRALPLDKLDTLIVNELEAQALSGCSDRDGIIAFMRSQYPHTRVVITLGSRGSILVTSEGLLKLEPTLVEVVDTTCAGDTFVGYFLQGLVSGLGDHAALKRASVAAALAVTQHGAINAIPYLNNVNELLNA